MCYNLNLFSTVSVLNVDILEFIETSQNTSACYTT